MQLDERLGRMTAHLTRTLTRRAPAERGTSSSPSATNITGPQAVPRRYIALAILGLACASLFIYGRSLTNALLGDDWALIEHSAGGLGPALSWIGNYHYNPVVHALLWVLYTFFGLNPIAYHGAALLFFWLGAVGIMYAAWRLSGRFTVGLIAAVLFIGHGRQYEGVIWGAVSDFQTVGLVLFLVGLIGYLRYLDPTLDRGSRRWAYILFVAAVVLSPFAYEPEVVLSLVCMLYRLLVVEHGSGFAWAELRRRARVWVRDFAAPVVFLIGYGAFKVWLGRTANQAPGLSHSISDLLHTAERGIAVSFVPGLALTDIAPQPLVALASARIVVWALAALAALGAAALIIRGGPLYRFLFASTLLLVGTMTLALGQIASRHILLLSVPAAILWALLLADATRTFGQWLRRSSARVRMSPAMGKALQIAPATLFALIWVALGSHYAFVQQQAWAVGAAEEDRWIGQIDALIRANPDADTLYLVNLPDYNASPTGDGDDPVYIFRNAPPSLIRLTQPHRFALVVAAYTGPYDPWRVGVSATSQQLAQWSEQRTTLVLEYDSATASIQQVHPSGTGATAGGSS